MSILYPKIKQLNHTRPINSIQLCMNLFTPKKKKGSTQYTIMNDSLQNIY